MDYFIKTYGCQQNESDSWRIAAFLENKGYKKAKSLEQADLIVINACSVRQTAIDRILGLKPKIRKLKSQNPNTKFILTGCVLKSDKKKFEGYFDEILELEEFLGGDYLCLKPNYIHSDLAFVSIMTGCDNFCSYCVVPYTRGREKSRESEEIIKEIKSLVKKGYKEITLLGQNVNSYKYGLSKLLRKLNALSGRFVIKFITNHPKDFSDELINTIANCKKIAKEIHLPIQSGDNTILKKMNRKYTVEQYKKLIKKIYKKIPNVKLSTDVIVGFPGETKKQFENTVKLFKEIKYNIAYINKYSPRAGTVSVKLKNNVSWNEKKRRWKILNDIVNQPKLIVVVGPTSSGKSDLAVKIAKDFNGEIISADSRQVYKGMDIGTGKITKKEMQKIPHHLLDVKNPKKRFTVAQYKQKALKAISDIYKKNKVPIICGGTGFYIQAVVEGLDIPKVKPDQKLRKELEKQTTEQLFKELKKLDPRRAKRIDSKNRRRLIRALEIIKITGKQVPAIKEESKFNTLYIGIKKDNKDLEELIEKRLLHRIRQGMIAEVKKLRESGISWKRLDDFGLEYRYVAKYLKGELVKQEMIKQLQKEIEHYAKRQITWFKRNKRIHWIKSYKEAEKLLANFYMLR